MLILSLFTCLFMVLWTCEKKKKKPAGGFWVTYYSMIKSFCLITYSLFLSHMRQTCLNAFIHYPCIRFNQLEEKVQTHCNINFVNTLYPTLASYGITDTCSQRFIHILNMDKNSLYILWSKQRILSNVYSLLCIPFPLHPSQNFLDHPVGLWISKVLHLDQG